MITGRDQDVIHCIQRFKYLRTSQIQRLFFHSKYGDIVCRRRLAEISRLMSDIRYISDIHEDERIWTVYQPSINSMASLERIKHKLEVVDTYIEATQLPGSIHIFEPEYAINKSLIADALMVHLTDPKKGIGKAYYIEVDRGTETLGRIRQKIEKYMEHMRGRDYLKQEWNKGKVTPIILFICQSEVRGKNIQRISQSIRVAKNLREGI